MARRHTAFAALALGSLAACSSDGVAPTAPAAVSPSVSSAGGEDAAQHLVVFEGVAIPADFADRVAALGGTVASRFDKIGVAAVAGLTDAAAAELRTAAGVTHLAADPVLSLDPLGGPLEAEAVAADVRWRSSSRSRSGSGSAAAFASPSPHDEAAARAAPARAPGGRAP